MQQAEFQMKAKVWLYPGPAAWHFISLPKKEAKIIRENFSAISRGFGSLKVEVTIGQTSWKTSIFPDKKHDTYVLPLKKDIRTKENIKLDQTVTFTIKILN